MRPAQISVVAEPTVLLFDIDGTLVLSGGGGRRAMEEAFAELYGRPDALDGIDFRGMTDGRIFRRALHTIDRPCDDGALATLVAVYAKHLQRTVADAESFRVLPGARELLVVLANHAHVATGLGTGNVEAGARIKLGRADLGHFFTFGGFGSDHDDRAELLRIGARRGAERLGVALQRCRVVVIGDTPLDVEAGRAAGAECVTVATGGYPADQLRAAGADVVFADLGDPRVLPALLG